MIKFWKRHETSRDEKKNLIILQWLILRLEIKQITCSVWSRSLLKIYSKYKTLQWLCCIDLMKSWSASSLLTNQLFFKQLWITKILVNDIHKWINILFLCRVTSYFSSELRDFLYCSLHLPVKMTSVVQGFVAYFCIFCIYLVMFNNVSGNVLFANNWLWTFKSSRIFPTLLQLRGVFESVRGENSTYIDIWTW